MSFDVGLTESLNHPKRYTVCSTTMFHCKGYNRVKVKILKISIFKRESLKGSKELVMGDVMPGGYKALLLFVCCWDCHGELLSWTK